MDRVVELEGVVAVVSRFPVLAGADLCIDRGEIVVLQGPNGAGKTSLLRLCAGLLPVERGVARILGANLQTERDRVRSRVGLLGHTNGLYLELSVARNVAFWGAMAGASRSEIERAMDMMGLSGRLADVPAARLSAGQRRRCALATLVVRRAELWLLDEPHAGLDAAGRDELDAVLRGAASAGATVLLASHERERVSGLATRTLIVDGGIVSEQR